MKRSQIFNMVSDFGVSCSLLFQNMEEWVSINCEYLEFGECSLLKWLIKDMKLTLQEFIWILHLSWIITKLFKKPLTIKIIGLWVWDVSCDVFQHNTGSESSFDFEDVCKYQAILSPLLSVGTIVLGTVVTW